MRARTLGLAIACVVVGCSSGDPESLGNLSDAERGELPVLDHQGVKEQIAQHQGRIVVLAGWSANQEGHEAFYKGLGGLVTGDAEAGPVVIAMNLDGAVAVRGKVLPLIRAVQPAFANCVFDGDQMMLTAAVDPDWAGLLPAVWLYDGKGKVAASFYGTDALDRARAKLAEMAEMAK